VQEDERLRLPVDILLLIDASGTMRACIEALQQHVSHLIEQLGDYDWRVAVWGYRDARVDKDRWLVRQPFTREVAELRAQLAALQARGGGDEPESLLDALYLAATLPSTARGEPVEPGAWRPRATPMELWGPKARPAHVKVTGAIVVFSDATFHPTMSIPEALGGTVEDVAMALITAQLRSLVLVPELPCYDVLSLDGPVEYICAAQPEASHKAFEAVASDPARFREVLSKVARHIHDGCASSTDSIAELCFSD
jgi:hypothetical protein